MIAQIVRFRSGLPGQEVLARYAARAPRYRAVPGLIQKYHLSFPGTGEHGAVYLWDSAEAMEAFRASELAGTIPGAYQVDSQPQAEVADVALVLREGATGRAQAATA
jgi:heme-degrading monooxygenase HmoA